MNDKVPTISIALATFNGARFIGQQLASLAAQTRLPDELVVCDDRSEDDTVAIVEAFRKTAPFPVFIETNETRLGFKFNFMKAAGLCKSDLISFCDQDDVWRNDKLAAIAPLFSDPDVLLAFHNSTVVDTDLNRVGPFYDAPPVTIQAPACGRPWWNAYGFSQVFRRSLLKHSSRHAETPSYEDDDIPLTHDQWMMFLAWSMGKIAYHEAELASYRQHGANLYGRRSVRFSEWARFVLEDRSMSYKRMANVSRTYASLLVEIAGEEAAPLDERARLTADSLKHLAVHYRDRAEACGGKSIGDRFSAYNRLRRAGLYNDDIGWSFGRKALLKDFALGVFVGGLGTSIRPRGSRGDVTVSRRPEHSIAAVARADNVDHSGYVNV